MQPPDDRSTTHPASRMSTAWLEVSDGLLRGISHAFNNRLAALGALARVLGNSTPGPLLGALLGEIDNIEEIACLLHLLPRERGERPEPVLLPDLLPDVLMLHQLQGGLWDVDYQVDGDPNILPVWAELSVLTRALLMMLNAAARGAQLRGGGVAVRYAGDEVAVRVTVESTAASADAEAAISPHREDVLQPVDAAAMAEMGRTLGGELSVEADAQDAEEGTRFTLHLPTLLEARRQERAG